MKECNRGSIVMVTECPYSGVFRAIIEHAKVLHSLGFSLTFIVPQTHRDRYGEKLAENKLELERYGRVVATELRRSYRTILSDARLLAGILTELSPSIVMSYAGYGGKVCRWLYHTKKISTLFHVPQCVDIIRRPWWQQPIERIFEHVLKKCATKYLACSRTEQYDLNNAYGIEKEKIVLLPNFLTEYKPLDAKEERAGYILLGRVTKDKRVAEVLETARAANIIQNCIIIGDGAELAGLRERYPTARFTGRLPHTEALALLSHARYSISYSIAEGLPFATLEAMSSGVIPILSAIPPHQELVEEGQNGYLCSTTDELKKKFLRAEQLRPPELSKLQKKAYEKSITIFESAQKDFIQFFSLYGRK